MKLSLVMIVKNESKRLARCLESVKGIVNEIVIVDTGSTDTTKQIAESFNAKIYHFQWINDFSAARNYALNQSSGDWNLVLDADEYITNDCSAVIKEFMQNGNHIGRVRILNQFIDDGEEKHSQSFISRIIPRGVFYEGMIHEQIISDLPRVIINVDVEHDGYIEASNKKERNLKLLHLALEKNSKDPYMLYKIGNEYTVAKNYEKADFYFSQCYTLALTNEIYRPMMVVGFLYNLIKISKLEDALKVIDNEKARLADYPDFRFVSGFFYMELIFKYPDKYLHLLPLIEKEYETCLALGDSIQFDGVVGTGTFYASYNLGVFYEVTGNLGKAKEYYLKAADYGYIPAQKRLLGYKN